MKNKGFTLIEILIGLSVSSAIFIVATSLVVNIFGSTTKNKQTQELEQAKNDLRVEFGNSIRWADTITFAGGELDVDTAKYTLENGMLKKNGISLTPEEVEITKFEVTKYDQTAATEGNIGTGVTAQYFNNDNFTNLVFTQTEFTVDFDWGEGSPDATLIDENTFSARYSGQIEAPQNGEITFYVNSDEGARLWIDNLLLIDDWDIPGPGERSGRVSLSGGNKYDFRLDYRENFGPASLQLLWSYPGVAKTVIPTNSLYLKSGSVSVQISIEMRHKNSISVLDTLKVVLSPRSGNISTIESP